jgi:predicted RNA-binding Zn ribbon-like protein
VGGSLCLDFLNTADSHDGAPGLDALAPGYVNVGSWFAHAGVLDEAALKMLLRRAAKEPRDAAAVRKRATQLREALYEIVTSLPEDREPSPESLVTFNGELHHANAAGAYVAESRRLEWRWHDERQLDRVLWEVCGSAAMLLSGEGMQKVRQCASPSCQKLFLDTSKNGSRQYCSPATCGTASRVRRFRERQRIAT